MNSLERTQFQKNRNSIVSEQIKFVLTFTVVFGILSYGIALYNRTFFEEKNKEIVYYMSDIVKDEMLKYDPTMINEKGHDLLIFRYKESVYQDKTKENMFVYDFMDNSSSLIVKWKQVDNKNIKILEIEETL